MGTPPFTKKKVGGNALRPDLSLLLILFKAAAPRNPRHLIVPGVSVRVQVSKESL